MPTEAGSLQPLTQAELGLWLGHQSASCPESYNCAEAVSLMGPLRVDAFGQALSTTLRSAPDLFRRFVETPDGPHAERGRIPNPVFEMLDLSGESDPEAAAQQSMRALLATPAELERGPLCQHRLYRLAPEQHIWFHQAHHILLDGYGFHLLRRAVDCHYRQGRAATNLGTTAAVVAQDLDYESGPQVGTDQQFWFRGPGAGAGAVRLLPYRSPSAALRLPVAVPRRRSFRLDSTVRWQLDRIAQAADASWVEALIALVAAFVAECTGRSCFALGLPVMLRLRRAAARVPCSAMNINRLPLTVVPGATPLSLAREVRNRLKQQSSHQSYRYESLRGGHGAASAFGPVVNAMPFQASDRFGDCLARVENLSAGPAEELSIAFYRESECLRCDLDAHPTAFDSKGLASLSRDLQRYIREAAVDGDAPLAPLASPGSDQTAPDEHPADDIVSVIEQRALAHPERFAFVSRSLCLSYSELLARARSVARWLRDSGVRPGDRVVFDLPRCPEAIVLPLGTLLAGAAYLAIDPSQPAERRQAIVDHVRAAVVIRQIPEIEDQNDDWGRAATRPSDAAYLVYTSGSTGTPKCVEVPRGALSHFCWAAAQRYALTESDRVLQFASLAFDASVEEIFVSLSVGATIVHRESAMLDSMRAFLGACSEQAISVLDLPTAFFHELCSSFERESLSWPASVRTVIIGGEAIERRALRGFFEVARGVRLFNSYGPSEATVVATVAELHPTHLQGNEPLPIGTPLAGLQARLRDASGTWLEGAGSEGELCLLGPTLASGYLGRDDLTEARFGHTQAEHGRPGERFYRTGDWARRLPSGGLAFLGRRDSELKISGYRVRLEEVEAAVRALPSVTACAVVAAAVGDAGLGLHAFVVSPEATTPQALAAWTLTQLPAPLVPSRWTVVSRLPTNVAGKIDRRQLLEEATGARGVAAPSFAPSATQTERKVCEVWQQVLGSAPADLDADFFECGGSSLQILQLVNRLSTPTRSLGVAQAFAAPTPRRLARILSGGDTIREDLDWTRVPELPPHWFVRRRSTACTTRRVLLTGATGFVGRYLLAELLRTGVNVSCVVRGASDAGASLRLQEATVALGLSAPELSRVEVLAGDLGQPVIVERLLAHSESAGGRWDAVVHCAAEVSLSRDFRSLRKANVLSTQAMIEVAARSGARLVQISTLAVAPPGGKGLPEAFVEPHVGLLDGYQRSKWQAEALCQAATGLGLEVAVCRLGRIVGPRSRPAINPRDIVWRMARCSVRAGCWPSLDIAEPWMPVDTTAKVIAHVLAATPPASGVYNLAHNGEVHLDRLRATLAELTRPLEPVSVAQWQQQVAQVGDAEDQATLTFFARRGRSGDPPAPARAAYERTAGLTRGCGAQPVEPALLRAYCRQALADWGWAPAV